MSRKYFFLMIFISTFLPTLVPLSAQEEEGEIIIISDRVGKEIDPEEREKFKLFERIKGFQSAVYIKLPDGRYFLKITYLDEDTGELKISRIQQSELSIRNRRIYIDRFEEIKAKRHQDVISGTRKSSDIKQKDYQITPYTDRYFEEIKAKKHYAQIKETLHVPDSGYVQILKSNDGSTLFGRITAIYDDEIEFTTDLGTLKFKITKIKSIEDVPQSSFKTGEYWFPNPNNTRLYFAPKGRMLKKGTGYFQDIYIFFAGFAYGLTDNFTLGGGTSLIPWIDIHEQVFYLTPKFGIKATEMFDLAVGALIANIPGDDSEDSKGAGILYGVGTLGNENSNFTLGFGYGFVGGDLAEKPMVMLGYEGRTSRRTAFVSENWIIPGLDVPLISYGFRFFGEKIAVDLAFINTLGEHTIFPGIPYVDFIYNF